MNIYDHSQMQMIELTLTPEDAIDPDLQVPPSERHSGPKADVEKDNIEVRIGYSPFAYSLGELYERAGRQLPPDMEVFRSYRIWVVRHTISVSKEPGNKDVRHLKYEVRFPREPKVTIKEVFPQTQFVDKFKVDLNNEFLFEAGINLEGEASPPQAVTEMLEHTESLSFGGKADAKLKLSTSNKVVGRLSFAVKTPIIQATGTGDYYSQWQFTKYEQPLIGEHKTIQILLVPKNVDELSFKARVSATITTFNMLPDTRRSNWVKLSVSLPREES